MFTYDSKTETPVLKDLRLCQATQLGSNEKHRTGAKCGEEMAAHIYYLLKPKGPPIRELVPQAAIGTVLMKGNELVQTDPCGSNFEVSPKSPQPLACTRRSTQPSAR